ncbi:circularly permuted type 2 ATP-grasp protein [Nocardia sp. NBC_00565]|uniref:circularly permuted type 2 ATP-grasp protein n=1 Tax=Nocardia sp. NBC_00565 TaxID=2975993 RepID=UPI002E7FEAC7|nr:circularly permuted type 2 ATP-grasp protein [Nocardia sp. NBC_00565]WUC08167.1 circularly permuted type 2 ATP-grasp protein [Nocardia sp. NBC_00565]
MRDEAQRGLRAQDETTLPNSGRLSVREQIAEQFARYRAEGADTAAYDECGRPMGGYYDELVDPGGGVRRMWSELSADFVELGTTGLGRLDSRVRRLIDDDGIYYTEVGAAVDPAVPTAWRLDPIPLLVSADDWTQLEAGLVQRSRVLDEVLTDIYGARRTITTGLLPPEVVFGNSGYVRAAHGITIPGRHQLFLHACDLSRWSDGQFRVIADWAQAPSGAGYALADRRVVSTAIPEAFEHSNPRPLTPFARAMRLMLIESAPMADDDDPVVVVLSPGVHSETAFDQAYLASTLGFPLVESADLVVRDGALWMRSLGTLKRVDVVLRRVDAEFSDPLDLRPDSRLGVVGLVEVLRRGAVTVVNTLGSGLLENPALAGFLPRISRVLLGEELALESAPTYWGGLDSERSHLIANLDRLIIRSAVDGATLFGPELSSAQRAELAARIEDRGWQWVGQEPAQFSVAPAVHGYGGLASAPVGMRLFSLARRGGYTAMEGGLGQLRQRLQPERVVIKVAAKDIWVRAAPTAVAAIGTEPAHEERERRAPALEPVSSPRVLSDLFWMGRYSERAEAAVRLLIATHEAYQDYRYRPWLNGAGALPALMAALARMTGTLAPLSVLPGGVDVAEEPSSAGAVPGSGASEPGADRGPSAADSDVIGAQGVGATEPSPKGPTDAVPESGSTGAEPRSTGAQSQSQSQRPMPEQTAARGQLMVAPGAGREGHDYLVALTVDQNMPGSMAFAINRYGSAARAVRDQLSADTWMILGAVDRALVEYRFTGDDQETALSAVHSLSLAALLSLSGIGAESLVRDTGWYVMDIGKRIERGLSLTALLAAALTKSYPAEAERVVTETVLSATESSVSYRRRHRDSVRVSAVAGLLLFDASNPRSLAYQLDRLEADLQTLPGASVSSRPQRLLADTKRMLRRVDPADLDVTDAEGRRTELAELLEGVHLRLRKISESFETTKLALPVGIQPLWGSTRVVG